MLSTMHPDVVQGILLPESVMHSPLFAVLAAFVAVNTVMYGALSLAKILPRVYLVDWFSAPNRRAETRSIHPASTTGPASGSATAEVPSEPVTPFEPAA